LISTQALFPYALDKWFGLNGNWFLLFGGVILVVTLIQNPDGVAGAFYRKTHRRPRFSPDLPEVALRPLQDDAAEARERRRVSAAGADPVLRVRGLSVAFGGVQALTDVDLDVGEGELVGLIGPNGAGKTTFVDAVTGFVRHSGSVDLRGQAIAGQAPHAIAALGCARTWQGTDLFDDLDVRETLTVAAGSGAAPEDIQAVLTQMGLAPVAEAMPAELSEGQRKLVGLARAVVGRPGLLCLDEPAAGMDTRESQALGRRLRELADQGQSTLLIDHDMGLVLGICDRVVVLEFGRVIANDAPEVVRRDAAVMVAYLGSADDAATAVVEKQ
jgi:branched-chain amino acid transport system ATP-binding protein